MTCCTCRYIHNTFGLGSKGGLHAGNMYHEAATIERTYTLQTIASNVHKKYQWLEESAASAQTFKIINRRTDSRTDIQPNPFVLAPNAPSFSIYQPMSFLILCSCRRAQG